MGDATAVCGSVDLKEERGDEPLGVAMGVISRLLR